MNEFFQISAFAGVTLSLVAYMIGMLLKKKLKLAVFNPLLISIVVTIIVLIVSKTDYEVYNITVTNNTEKTILLNDGKSPEKFCLRKFYSSTLKNI